MSWAGRGICILLTRNEAIPDATRREARTLVAVSVKRPVEELPLRAGSTSLIAG
jgi:hypothetical protein